jgi:hypothetical protein
VAHQITKTVFIPEEVDALIQEMLARDPDLSYSAAVRKILRAGREAIVEDARILSGQSQIDMAALGR